jgi:hypothetical protein
MVIEINKRAKPAIPAGTLVLELGKAYVLNCGAIVKTRSYSDAICAHVYCDILKHPVNIELSPHYIWDVAGGKFSGSGASHPYSVKRPATPEEVAAIPPPVKNPKLEDLYAHYKAGGTIKYKMKGGTSWITYPTNLSKAEFENHLKVLDMKAV